MTVGEVSKLFGVSVRTLRYYDEIGLLPPARATEAGYRLYGSRELEALQQILFYRELEFPLAEVKRLLGDPRHDRRDALKKRRELLLAQRERVDGLIALVEATIEEDECMGKEKRVSGDYESLREEYAREAREKYGATAEYAQSERKRAGRGGAENEAMEREADEIFEAFAHAMDEAADGEIAAELVGRWRAHITRYYYDCTKEILSCLGQMYVSDERFTRNIDRFGDGTARFMSEAIAAYCARD